MDQILLKSYRHGRNDRQFYSCNDSYPVSTLLPLVIHLNSILYLPIQGWSKLEHSERRKEYQWIWNFIFIIHQWIWLNCRRRREFLWPRKWWFINFIGEILFLGDTLSAFASLHINIWYSPFQIFFNKKGVVTPVLHA